MTLAPGDIERLIRDALPDASVSVTDLRGDGSHFAARVVSPSFRGLSLVDQHRMIHAAVKELDQDRYALAIQTAAPHE